MADFRIEDGRLVRDPKKHEVVDVTNGGILTVAAANVDGLTIDDAAQIIFDAGNGDQVTVPQIVAVVRDHEELKQTVEAQDLMIRQLEETLTHHEIRPQETWDARVMARMRKVEDHLKKPEAERGSFEQPYY